MLSLTQQARGAPGPKPLTAAEASRRGLRQQLKTRRSYVSSAVAPAATSGASAPVPSANPPRIKSFGFARGFADHFLLDQHLGSGSFGSVHVAINKITRQKFAVKTIKKKFLGQYLETALARRVQHEVDIYNRLGRSLNVAHMYAAYEDDHCVDMVMELCSGGELWQRVRQGKYSEHEAAVILREVLRAVAQCHAKGIVLRDVKPDNFLFLGPAEDAPLKMIDFGLAEYCQEGQYLSDRAGSLFYTAPEVLRRKFSLKADVWSAGIIAYELLTGRLPFLTEEGTLMISDLQQLRGAGIPPSKEINAAVLSAELDFHSPPWDVLSCEAKDLVQQLLDRDESRRPSAAKALQHPWLKGTEPFPDTTSTTSMGTLGTMGTMGSMDLAAGSSSMSSMGSMDLEGQPRRRGRHSVPLSDSLVQRLQRYGGYSKLKKVALRKVAEFVARDPSMVSDMREAFAGVDPAGTGKVPYEAAVALLDSGRFDLSDLEIRTLLSSFHIDGEGLVDYFEWLAAFIDWKRVQHTPQWEAWVQKVFGMLDLEGNGKITTADLEAALCADECPFPDEVPAAMREVGHYEDPRVAAISFEEFRRELREAAAERLELFESRRVQRASS